MRRVLYRVAASVDGYIAGPRGEADWIVHDSAVDFAKVYESVDTVLLGRRTYELTRQPGAPPWPPGWQIYVFSRTLTPEEHPGVTVVRAWRAVSDRAVPLIPVGGISPDNMQPFLDAGANGFGLGSALYRPGQSADTTAAHARAFQAGLRVARGGAA